MSGRDSGNEPPLRESIAETLHGDGDGARDSKQADQAPAIGPGSRVGRYLILHELGRGGMGVVHLAYDPELDRRVALKLLHARSSDKKRAEQHSRLRREAQAMARLTHPNVVGVYDVGEHDDRIFVAMEYVDGKSLRQFVATKPDWREIVAVFEQAGRGLAAAHEKGLIHRDFKPENVMIGSDGRPRVMDFGLARAGEVSAGTSEESSHGGEVDSEEAELRDSAFDLGLTRDGAFLGTPSYMAPEQLVGSSEVSPATDQFSFCVALWEALYGERPFQGETLAALAFNVSRGRVQSTPRAPKVPPRIHRALLRGLTIDRSARWPGMTPLLDELVAASARTRRWAVAATLGGVLVLGVVAWASTTTERCPTPSAALDGVWDLDRRTAVVDAFVATELGHAPDTAGRVVEALDAWTAGFIAARHEACLATEVRAEQSAELMDLRMACLDEQRRRVAALVEVFGDADARVVQNALDAVGSLPDIAYCEDAERLHAEKEHALPDDPALEAPREALARGRALHNAGKYADARTLARRVRVETRATGDHPTLVIDALAIDAGATAELGEVEEARRLWIEVFEASIRHDIGGPGADAAIELISIAGVDGASRSEGELWLGVARAFADRVQTREYERRIALEAGYFYAHTERIDEALELLEFAVESSPSDARRTAALNHYAAALMKVNRFDKAARAYSEAVDLARRAFGPEHPTTARVLLNEGANLFSAGRLDEAEDRFEQAVALADRAFDEPNSLVADGWMNLGVIHTNRRELGAAREAYARALDAYAATVGERHPNARRILGNLAVLELASQNLDAAQRYLDRALALVDDLETTTDPDAAASYTNYGDLELRRKRPADALAHYARARRMMEASLGADVLWVAFPLTGEAMALVELGRYEEAADAAQRALLIRKEAPAEEREASRFALARARWELGKHEDAMTLAEQARAALDPALPTHTELHAEITRWLADRP